MTDEPQQPAPDQPNSTTPPPPPGHYPPPTPPYSYTPPQPGQSPPLPNYYGPGDAVPGGAGYPLPGPQTSGRAIAVLVLGICSIVFFWLCCFGLIPGIVAVALAGSSRAEIARSNGALTGDKLIKPGVICGWVGIGLGIAYFVLSLTLRVGLIGGSLISNN
ncbi:MAG: hypothetical protein ACRCTR_02850 [Actinomycetota bacterium]